MEILHKEMLSERKTVRYLWAKFHGLMENGMMDEAKRVTLLIEQSNQRLKNLNKMANA